MLIYRTDGGVETVDLGGRAVTLAELQAAVEGWIEAVPRSGAGGGIAFCNEEGRLRGLTFNARASLRFGQTLVGNVVELDPGEFAAAERSSEVL